MQKAEEMQTKWIKVPRIAVFAFESARDLIGGGTGAKEDMETALAKAEEQWTNGIEAEVQMCSSRYEPVDGADKVPTDSRGNVHGMAKCTWPDGEVYIGEYQHGKKHGHGTYNYADGSVYVGEYQRSKMHGRGKYTYPNGNFELGFYVAGKDSGESVQFSKDRQKAWLLKDGEIAQELSPSEAAKKVEELGLLKLLDTEWVLDPIWKDFGRRRVTKSCQSVVLFVKFAKKWRVVYYFDRKINWHMGLKIIVLSCSVCHVSISKKGIHVTKWSETGSGFLRNVLVKYHSSHNHGSEKWVPPIVVLPLENRHFPLQWHYGR